MTELPPISADLDAIRVDAATAGGRVLLELSGLHDLRVTISDAYYRETPESAIAADLGRAIRLLVARRQDAVQRASASSDARADLVPGSRLADEVAGFNEEMDAFTTEVSSPDGSLRATTTGMREFVVEVAPGTRTRLSVTEVSRMAERLGVELIARRVRSTLQARMERFQRDLEERVLHPG